MSRLTYETKTAEPDRAVVVSLITPDMKRDGVSPEHSLDELIQLAVTAGVEVTDQIVQYRDSPDPRFSLGKGKALELRDLLQEQQANMAVFDRELSGAQVRNLEQLLDVRIIDRTQLILDIFAQRARTREGIIQVELAQLTYLLPRLSGQGKNLSRLGAGIGTRGPGESKLETDRRHIRRRIGELKRQLHEVTRHRQLHRSRRKESGIVQIALVGYTNAGKSTLLKALTAADVLIENRLFATLDPTSRAMQLPGGREVVLTDTVGFIQNLPHDLIAAFRATLEEVNEADLILHVIDASSPMREEQQSVVDRILHELGAGGKPQIILYNKMDLCEDRQLEMLHQGSGYLKVSALNEGDMDRIREVVQESLSGGLRTFRIPAARGDLMPVLYRVGQVVNHRYDESDTIYSIDISRDEYDKYAYLLAPFATEDQGEHLKH